LILRDKCEQFGVFTHPHQTQLFLNYPFNAISWLAFISEACTVDLKPNTQSTTAMNYQPDSITAPTQARHGQVVCAPAAPASVFFAFLSYQFDIS
jgi:hypothetical protein